MARVEDKTDDLLERLVRNFDEWLDATQDQRDEAEAARDYYDGVQWKSSEIAELKKRKQPPITDNLIKDKIEYLVGLELASRTDPKAYPRTPNHDEDAEAATDALRYVADANDYTQIKSDVAENLFIEGDGGAEVYVREKKSGHEVVIKRNRWERRFWDPHSSEYDYSDARYLGTFVWMDFEAAQERWPELDFWNLASADLYGGETSDADRPRNKHIDRSRKRIRIIEEYFLRNGRWWRSRFVRYGYIEKPEPSPYLDEEGEPEHPYCWMSAYVDRENRRYGLVRRFKDLQDEVNHRRSRALHILNTNQVLMEDGAVDDVERARREANRPDGVLVYRQGYAFALEKNLDLAAGQADLLRQAQEGLKGTGPKAFQNSTASASGRSKQIDRQADLLELGRLLDRIRYHQKQVFCKAWNRVRQFWTSEKWIRVRDDEGEPKFVQINHPITAVEALQEAMEKGDPKAQEYALIAQVSPQTVVGVRNHVAELEVDIVIDESPDVVTLQQEQFANLIDLARAGVVFPPEVYVQASSLRNKKQLLDKLSGGDNPEAQQAAQEAAALDQAMKEGQVAEQQAKAAETAEKAKQIAIENAAGMAGLAGLATN